MNTLSLVSMRNSHGMKATRGGGGGRKKVFD